MGFHTNMVTGLKCFQMVTYSNGDIFKLIWKSIYNFKWWHSQMVTFLISFENYNIFQMVTTSNGDIFGLKWKKYKSWEFHTTADLNVFSYYYVIVWSHASLCWDWDSVHVETKINISTIQKYWFFLVHDTES